MAVAKLMLVLCVVAMCGVSMTQGASSSRNTNNAAPAPAPAPAVECSTVVLTMADCLSYVTNGSTATNPEGTCCSGLKTVLKTAPQCLCEAFKNSAQFGIVLNVTKALTLPAACKLNAPPLSDCGLTQPPTSAPGTGGKGLTPESSPTPTSADVSPLSPLVAPTPGNSASSLIPISPLSILLSLLVAVAGSFSAL